MGSRTPTLWSDNNHFTPQKSTSSTQNFPPYSLNIAMDNNEIVLRNPIMYVTLCVKFKSSISNFTTGLWLRPRLYNIDCPLGKQTPSLSPI